MIQMPLGTHHLKFIVDNEWKCSDDLPTATDPQGNLINYLSVSNNTPTDEELEQESNLSTNGTFSTDIPKYLEHPSTMAESPPLLPAYLSKVILNAQPDALDPTLLPVPNHVCLNHLYACSIRDNVVAVSSTNRYREKVKYKLFDNLLVYYHHLL